MDYELTADELLFGAEVSDEDAALIAELSAGVDDGTVELAHKPGESLDRSPKKNWVENAGGLPKYINDIAHDLHTERGMTISRAIATAISRVKKWAAGGDNVKPDTRAKAAAALAEWEALKAKSKAKSAAK